MELMGITKPTFRKDTGDAFCRVDGRRVSLQCKWTDKTQLVINYQHILDQYNLNLELIQPGEIYLSQAIAKYLKSRRNLNSKSQKTDRRTLKYFRDFLKETYNLNDCKMKAINLEKLEFWTVWLSKKMTDNSVHVYQTYLKTFFNTLDRWTQEAGKTGIRYLEFNPVRYYKRVRKEQKKIILLSEDEKQDLIEKAQTHPILKTVIPVCIYTGIPIKEICSPVVINNDEFHYKRNKTRKQVTIPIHPRLKLYLGQTNRIVSLCKVSSTTLSHAHKKFVSQSKYGGLTMHQYRHNFAIALLRNNVRVDVVADLLGHSDHGVTVLKNYARFIKQDKLEAIRKLS